MTAQGRDCSLWQSPGKRTPELGAARARHLPASHQLPREKPRVIVTLVHISDIGRAMHQNQQKRPPTAACVPSKGAPGGSAHSGVLLTPCLVAHIRDVDAGQRAVRLCRAITQGSGHCAQNGRGDAGEDGEPRPATDLRHHLVTRLDHPVAELLQGLGLQLPRAPKLVWNVTPRTTLWRPSKSCS